jgi:hypothetical protein
MGQSVGLGKRDGASGHGRVKLAGKLYSPHRMAYHLTNGLIPELAAYHGMMVMHTCDNPGCCNPKHLVLGSARDNAHGQGRQGTQRIDRTKGENRLSPGKLPLASRTEKRAAEIMKMHAPHTPSKAIRAMKARRRAARHPLFSLMNIGSDQPAAARSRASARRRETL